MATPRRGQRGTAVRRRLTAAAGVLVMIGLAAACAPAPPGDFYDAPDPLPFGKPGKLIWAEPMTSPGPGLASARVMYHSRDAQDRDVAVTGTVSYPTAAPPTGGWPVVSYGHGAEGMAPQCAPSRRGATGSFWGVQGVAVASDYVRPRPERATPRTVLGQGRGPQHDRPRSVRSARSRGSAPDGPGSRSACPRAATRRCSPVSAPRRTHPSSP